MPSRESVKASKRTETEDVSSPDATGITKKSTKLKKDMDKLMDEIDDVLQENHEEFLRHFYQRSGE